VKELARNDDIGSSDAYRFLIESEGELQEAIGSVIVKDNLSLRASVRGAVDVPGTYPYIVCIYGDEEYDFVSLAFVTVSDFFDGPNYCQQIRDQLINAETMKCQMERINDAIQAKESEVEFRDLDDEPNPDNQYCLNNAQAEWFRLSGFKVNWEKYPRTWKVSGWF
jgi:hypothetical protein